jgi:hypothetical protein
VGVILLWVGVFPRESLNPVRVALYVRLIYDTARRDPVATSHTHTCLLLPTLAIAAPRTQA